MEQRRMDYWTLLSTLLLISIGVMMVYSASAIFANEKYHDSYFFLKKEIVFSILAIFTMLLFTKIDYHFYWKLVYPFLFFTFFLCILVLIPHIGVKAGGARRWLSIAGFQFQPSELAKLSFILFLAYSLAKKREKMERFTIGVLPNAFIASLMMGLILLEKDLGTPFTLGVVFMILLYVGGTRISYFAVGILLCIPIFYFFVVRVPFRWARVVAYLDPWAHVSDSGYQVIQSYIGFNNGGIWGSGLGQGQQKLDFLPAAPTDFILSVIGEELGLLGVLMILCLFAILMFRGFKTSLQAPDLFGKYLALGITTLLATQAFINCGVVMGLLPNKGLPLPFISYGGTSLIVMSMSMGILINISSQIGIVPPSMEATLPTRRELRKY